MKAMSRYLALGLALFGLSIGLVGCGQGGDAKPETATSGEKPTAEATEPTPAPKPVEPLAEPPKPVEKTPDAIKPVGTMDGLELNDYPDAKAQGKGNKAVTATTEDFTFNFTTSDAPAKVVEFYKPQITVEDSYADEATGFVFGKTKSGYEATVNAAVMDGTTQITIVVVKPKA